MDAESQFRNSLNVFSAARGSAQRPAAAGAGGIGAGASDLVDRISSFFGGGPPSGRRGTISLRDESTASLFAAPPPGSVGNSQPTIQLPRTQGEESVSLLGSMQQRVLGMAGYGGVDTAPTRWYNDDNCGLTWLQRMTGFVVCFGLGILLFFLSFFSLPLAVLRPAKFASTYTLGSVLVIAALALLRGPRAFFVHLFSGERIIFTLAYFGGMGLTLYFSMGKSDQLLAVVCIIVQIAALAWFLSSYLPGGARRSFALAGARSYLPL